MTTKPIAGKPAPRRNSPADLKARADKILANDRARVKEQRERAAERRKRRDAKRGRR